MYKNINDTNFFIVVYVNSLEGNNFLYLCACKMSFMLCICAKKIK